MTTKDKTGDQLMASIRKTKTEAAEADKQAGGAPQTAAATPKAAPAKAKPAAATKARRPRATKKKVTARPQAAAQTKATPSGSGAAPGGYQSPGRVWPD